MVKKRAGDGSDGDGGNDSIAAERAKMARNKQQAEAVGKMLASGASGAQLSAYTGVKLVKMTEGFEPTLMETPSHMFVDRDKEGAWACAYVNISAD